MKDFMHILDDKKTDKEQIDVNIMIAIPSMDTWNCQFGMALAGLMFYLAQVPVLENVRKQRVTMLNRRASMLSQSRESLLQEAIDRECTHMLLLDSDMTFPDDTAHQLFKHNRTYVGANYVRKTIPSSPVTAALGGGLTFTDPDSTGIEEVLHIGMGVALLRLSDVKDIPSPRFTMEWNPELDCYSGEDVFFCGKLAEHGVPVYVDHDLSKQVTHVGSFNFDHGVVGDVETIVRYTGEEEAASLKELEAARNI